MKMRIRHSAEKGILIVLILTLLLSCGAGVSAYASPFVVETGTGDNSDNDQNGGEEDPSVPPSDGNDPGGATGGPGDGSETTGTDPNEPPAGSDDPGSTTGGPGENPQGSDGESDHTIVLPNGPVAGFTIDGNGTVDRPVFITVNAGDTAVLTGPIIIKNNSYVVMDGGGSIRYTGGIDSQNTEDRTLLCVYASTVQIEDVQLILASGTTCIYVTNGSTTDGEHDGKIIMDGGSLHPEVSTDGGTMDSCIGIQSYTLLTAQYYNSYAYIEINGGTIEGFSSGVYAPSGFFTMNGGEIRNCKTGCLCHSKSVFNGGSISNSSFCGIDLTAGLAEYNGGSISGCQYGVYGSNTYSSAKNRFRMKGGIIADCTCGIYDVQSCSLYDGQIQNCNIGVEGYRGSDWSLVIGGQQEFTNNQAADLDLSACGVNSAILLDSLVSNQPIRITGVPAPQETGAYTVFARAVEGSEAFTKNLADLFSTDYTYQDGSHPESKVLSATELAFYYPTPVVSVASGNWKNTNWVLDSEGVLTLSPGTGSTNTQYYPEWAGYKEEIQSVVVEQGVTTISAYAFNECTNLKTITIPNSVTSIEIYATRLCDALTDVFFDGTQAQWDKIDINYEYDYRLAEVNIHTIAYAFDTWYGLDWYLDNDGILTISGNGDNGLMHSVFVNDAWRPYGDQIKTVVIKESVGNLGAFAFYDCQTLTSITIPTTITQIGREAFYQCSNLTDVYYNGTQQQWNQIAIDRDNECLTSATLHCAYTTDGTGITGQVEVVSVDEVRKHSFTYTLETTVDAVSAGQMYGAGVEISNRSDFSMQPETICFANLNTELTGSCVNTFLSLETGFSGMIPGVTYYVRGALFNLDTGEIIVTGNNIRSFTVSPELISFTNIELGGSFVLPADTELDAKFTATETGLYSFSTDNRSDWVEVLNAGGWVMQSDGQQEGARRPLHANFFAEAGQTVYFNGLASENSTVSVVPAESVIRQLVPGSALAVDSGEWISFTAPGTGYYNIGYVDGNTQNGIQRFDQQTGRWSNDPRLAGRKYNSGEKLILRATYNQPVTGKLSLLATEVIPPAADSIEVGAAGNVTNRSMTLDFTLNVTESTAEKGYDIGILWGPDPKLEIGTSMTFFGRFYAARNNETLTVSRSSYVPGQDFYYRAILANYDHSEEIFAIGNAIHHVQFESSLNGFQALTQDVPWQMNSSGQASFYFTAPADDMYAVEANGLNSIQIQDNGGGPVAGEGGSSNYLFGTYIKAGERIFITTAMNNGATGDVAVYNGLNRLPGAMLGTQLLQNRVPVRFTAPEDGEYRFSVDNPAGLSVVIDGELKFQGMYYHTSLIKGQSLWMDSSFNPAYSVTLTIEQGVFPTSVLTFPMDLTELQTEACRGLSIEEAVFGTGIQMIGSRAFAECYDLQKVVIPAADVNIAEDAFLSCSCVTLTAPAGGSVEAYAQRHFNVIFQALEN